MLNRIRDWWKSFRESRRMLAEVNEMLRQEANRHCYNKYVRPHKLMSSLKSDSHNNGETDATREAWKVLKVTFSPRSGR